MITEFFKDFASTTDLNVMPRDRKILHKVCMGFQGYDHGLFKVISQEYPGETEKTPKTIHSI
jgi:hypothetical protein